MTDDAESSWSGQVAVVWRSRVGGTLRAVTPSPTHGARRRVHLRMAGVVVVLAALIGLTTACRAEPAALPVATVLGGLDHPWDMAFTPGGNLIFTERSGRISILFNGQRRVLATPTDVVVVGEAGMLGVAVDPAFSTNRRIYTCMASNLSGTNDVRVVR